MKWQAAGISLNATMKRSLSFQEIVAAYKPRLLEMRRVGAAFPDDRSVEASASFKAQVSSVEAAVMDTYAGAARGAREADSLCDAADIWKRMAGFCHDALEVLAQLKDKYPECGTGALYDLVLDYKLASDKRYQGTLEEIECLKTPLPRGLLPGLK